VLRYGARYDELKKEVKTKGGDKALVFDTEADGNCLIYALARCFHKGYPLSLAIEHQLMLLLRSILSEHMRTHTWEHPYIAHPQTIDECIHSTATEGEW
jgi:hypothetical protein